MKILILVICFFSLSNGVMAQITDTIWSGDYEGLNYGEHHGDVRGPYVIDSIRGKDSLIVKKFTIYGDSLLPDYLLNFKNLIRLDIQGFNDIKNIDILSQLPNLKQLFLSNSNFKTIPKGMGQLEEFYVEHNYWKYTTVIEDYSGLKDMKNLQSLCLRDCKLMNLPLEISELVQLKELKIGGRNSIRNFKGLEKLVNLEILSIGYIRKRIPKEIQYLTKLKQFKFLAYSQRINLKPLYMLKELEVVSYFYFNCMDLDCQIKNNLKKIRKYLPNVEFIMD